MDVMNFIFVIPITLVFTGVTTKMLDMSSESVNNMLFFQDYSPLTAQSKANMIPPAPEKTTVEHSACVPRMCCAMTCSKTCGKNEIDPANLVQLARLDSLMKSIMNTKNLKEPFSVMESFVNSKNLNKPNNSVDTMNLMNRPSLNNSKDSINSLNSLNLKISRKPMNSMSPASQNYPSKSLKTSRSINQMTSMNTLNSLKPITSVNSFDFMNGRKSMKSEKMIHLKDTIKSINSMNSIRVFDDTMKEINSMDPFKSQKLVNAMDSVNSVKLINSMNPMNLVEPMNWMNPMKSRKPKLKYSMNLIYSKNSKSEHMPIPKLSSLHNKYSKKPISVHTLRRNVKKKEVKNLSTKNDDVKMILQDLMRVTSKKMNVTNLVDAKRAAEFNASTYY